MRGVIGTALLVLAMAAAEVAQAGHIPLAMVGVGDAGNPADSTGWGSVRYPYAISAYEVTNAQYAAFLNAVAQADPFGLYNQSMSSDARGGILRSGSAGNWSYATKAGYANVPVVYVSWYDAVRYCNWLTSGNTESGNYAIDAKGNVTAPDHALLASGYFLPTENEWVKAAYYQPAAAGGDADGYWLYPTRSNAAPLSDQPAGLGGPPGSAYANYFAHDRTANGYDDGFAATRSSYWESQAKYLSDVGAYAGSPSYYGTFDQGGNVWEWTETVDLFRYSANLRGGSFASGYNVSYTPGATYSQDLQSTRQVWYSRLNEGCDVGFRVGGFLVPEPSGPVGLSGVLLAGWIVGWLRRRAVRVHE